jgi:hypothetical protein
VPLKDGPLSQNGTLSFSISLRKVQIRRLEILVVVHTVERNGGELEVVASGNLFTSLPRMNSTGELKNTVLIGRTVGFFGEGSFEIALKERNVSGYHTFTYLTCEANQFPEKDSCQCVNKSQILTKESDKNFCKSCDFGCETCI